MFPASVNILGTGFQVIVAPIETGEAGISDACARTIRINSQMPEDTQKETFYHEVVHVIMDLSGVSSVLGKRREEMVAQCLGYGLYHFFFDNAVTSSE